MSTSTTELNMFAGARRLSPEEMAMRREDLLEQLRGMLAARQLSGADVAAELGVSRGTAHDYLHRLKAAGEAHRTEQRDEFRRDLWAAGAATGHVGGQHDACQRRTRIVPARQVGMVRDALVAALFGPARQGAAA